MGDFTYEGTQIRTDYINFNTLRRQFGKTIFSPDSYTETFSSAAWYDNPGSEYDKYRGYTLPIIRQIGPKANIDDIWGAKLRLYNQNNNTYHTSPNNYSNDEPWIKVTFVHDILLLERILPVSVIHKSGVNFLSIKLILSNNGRS